ncbi:MAG: hypothetical protein R2838_22920 [Caldilineaceae bacterium]
MVRPHFRQLWIPFLLAMTLLVAACQSGAPAATAPEEKEPAAAAAVTEKSATETEAEVAAQADPDAAPTGADTLRFTIVPDGTEARFYIDEVLMGNDVTVVGVTSLVDGELIVDPTHPAGATIGPIRIDGSGSDHRPRTAQRRHPPLHPPVNGLTPVHHLHADQHRRHARRRWRSARRSTSR